MNPVDRYGLYVFTITGALILFCLRLDSLLRFPSAAAGATILCWHFFWALRFSTRSAWCGPSGSTGAKSKSSNLKSNSWPARGGAL